MLKSLDNVDERSESVNIRSDANGIIFANNYRQEDSMFARKIQIAALSVALLVPSAAFAEHHNQTEGAVIGGVAGALIGHGVRSAAVGAAAGLGVQALRNHEDNLKARRYAAAHHHRHHRKHRRA
jgi:hypothetical protein